MLKSRLRLNQERSFATDVYIPRDTEYSITEYSFQEYLLRVTSNKG